jgi:ribonuclease G
MSAAAKAWARRADMPFRGGQAGSSNGCRAAILASLASGRLWLCLAVTCSLIWDAGPGEVRLGLAENGQIMEFRIIRLRRDKALLQAGEVYTLRITSHLGGRQALATMSLGEDGLVAPCDAPEGTFLAAEMLRPPIPEPGKWKRARYRPLPDIAPQSAPGWHFSDEPWALALHAYAPLVDDIICPDAASANEVTEILGTSSPVIKLDRQAIEDADFEKLIEQAVLGEFPLPDGQLSIERTRAMTVIDVDGRGDPLKLNCAAAVEIPGLLRLLDIGGPIAVDFVSMKTRADRLAVDAALENACAVLGPHERTAINGFGLCQIIRPRQCLSIPEWLCGTGIRQLSLESRAIALLRAAGRSEGVGKRQLVARAEIIDLIRQWPEETGALRSSLGVEIELVGDATAPGYGHVHVSQG